MEGVDRIKGTLERSREREHSSTGIFPSERAAPLVEQLRSPPAEDKEHGSAKDGAGDAPQAATVEQLRSPPVEDKEHVSAKDGAGDGHQAAPVEQLRVSPVEDKEHSLVKATQIDSHGTKLVSPHDAERASDTEDIAAVNPASNVVSEVFSGITAEEQQTSTKHVDVVIDKSSTVEDGHQNGSQEGMRHIGRAENQGDKFRVLLPNNLL